MAKGFLSMFEDPVVGPQVAMGLLSTGLGLLTSPPEGVNRALQGGLGQISKGLYYGGRQKAKETAEKDAAAKRAAAAEKFRQILSGGNGQGPPLAPSVPSYTPGQGGPPFAPAAAIRAPVATPGAGAPAMGGIPPEVAQYIQYAIENPEAAPIINPLIERMMTATKKTPFQQYLADAGIPEGSETAKHLALMKAGGAPTIEQTATERYRQQLDEDRNAGIALQERGLGLTAAGQSQTIANQAATRALEERKFAFEKNKPPPMTDFDRKMAAANIPLGSPEYLAAAKANIPQPDLLPIEKALAAEGIDPGSEEGMAALKKARPGEAPGLFGGLTIPNLNVPADDAGMPVAPVAPPPPAPPPTDGPPVPVVPPEPTVAEKVADAVGLGPEPVTPVPTIGEMEDVRLEKRLGPEKAAGLRTMLGAITDPAKQKQASGVLRRVAKGTLGIKNAAKELEEIGL